MDTVTQSLGRILIYLGILLIILSTAIFTIWFFARKKEGKE